MKTIIHIELSDKERSDLAIRIHRDPDTKVLVTRKEVVEHVQNFIAQELKNIQEPVPEMGTNIPKPDEEIGIVGFTPSRGDEDYLAQPKDVEIAAACSRILDDTAFIEAFAWETVERNRKK